MTFPLLGKQQTKSSRVFYSLYKHQLITGSLCILNVYVTQIYLIIQFNFYFSPSVILRLVVIVIFREVFL